MKSERFDKIVIEQFQFLESQYRFRLSENLKKDWGYSLTYLSDKTGVKITYENRESYIFIMLYKLVEGKLIENPISISMDTPLNGYGLDDIINIKNPSDLIKPAYQYGAESNYYDKQNGLKYYISAFADNLRKYAADVLAGDFQIFKEADKIVRERVKKYQ